MRPDQDEELVLSFNIVDGFLIKSDCELTETLTEEDKEEINAIADSLQCSNPQEKDQSYSAFRQDADASRFASLNDDLDKIASNNCTKTTATQTTWAVKILKGIYITYKFYFIQKIA